MDNFLNYFNQPASPMFIMLAAGFGGFIFVAFAFVYDWYETKNSKK